MEMSYKIVLASEPGMDEEMAMWNIRIFSNNQVCGKLCFGTVEKDAFKAKLDELGWTEKVV